MPGSSEFAVVGLLLDAVTSGGASIVAGAVVVVATVVVCAVVEVVRVRRLRVELVRVVLVDETRVVVLISVVAIIVGVVRVVAIIASVVVGAVVVLGVVLVRLFRVDDVAVVVSIDGGINDEENVVGNKLDKVVVVDERSTQFAFSATSQGGFAALYSVPSKQEPVFGSPSTHLIKFLHPNGWRRIVPDGLFLHAG